MALQGEVGTLEGQTPSCHQSALRTLSRSDLTRIYWVLTTACQQCSRPEVGQRPPDPPTSLLDGSPPSSLHSAGVHVIPVTCRCCVMCSGFSGELDTLLDWQRGWQGSQTGKQAIPVSLPSPRRRKAETVHHWLVLFSLGHENMGQVTGEESHTNQISG